MNILCVNTCFNETYVALKTENKLICKQIESSYKQSENILKIINDCMIEANINVQDLTHISCVTGPGSFTGIRIGASLLKGFCMPFSHIKKIEVNSLDLLAYAHYKTNPNTDYYVALNALSGNIFAKKFDKDFNAITDSMLIKDEHLNNEEYFVGAEFENLSFCKNFVKFSCEDLMEYTNVLIKKEQFSNDFMPLYIRKSQAEQELENKNGNN